MPQHALILHYISLKACFTHPVRLVACQFIFLCTHCFIFLFTSSAILLYHFVATPLCTTLKFSDHVVMSSLTLLSPNSLCSGQLSSRHSFQPIILGGKRVSVPILPMLPRLLRLVTGHGYHVVHGARVQKVLSESSAVVA